MSKKIELVIMGLSHSVTATNNYAVILNEKDGSRRLPIVIGGYEAQAIATAMEGIVAHRPLTHDLFKSTLETFDIELQSVLISNLDEGVFYARLVCVKDGMEVEIDSRTSDAIAMAVRMKCPIFTYENILESAGVVLEESMKDEEDSTSIKPAKSITSKAKSTSIQDLSDDELEQLLDQVLSEENYEKAAAIRDEIKKRQK
jgi:uncharacterized protein